jgi:soluble lytic murein transglycosylase
MLAKFTKDEFIKSWIEYKKGNYSQSMLMARDAMEKIKEKPVKDDLRWRLVYPQNYYMQVHKFASEHKNKDALITAIIREESYFNPDSQSSVGAIGLMQLMPSTAHDIGDKNGISFNTRNLFNPELNIRLGNIYYSTLRGSFGGKDVSAIAAYNGGIGSVSVWRTNLNYLDTDEFVEQIPYDETKNYVKKVFRSYWNYIKIYQQD